MKFSLVLACLAAEALASIAPRDLKTITGVLDSVKSDLQKLDETVKSSGTDPEPLLKASNAFIATLKGGKTKVDGTDALTLTDAVQLTTPVQELTKIGKTLVADLKAIRPKVEELGLCDAVRTQTSSIDKASQDLIKSVVGKVPEEARDIANQLSADLTKVLKESQEDFSESNCKNKSGGGGGKPTGGSPSSAPAGSSAAPSSAAPTTAAPGTSAPAITGTGGVTVVPTATGTSSPPVITAGAAAFAPAGALAMAVAALVL